MFLIHLIFGILYFTWGPIFGEPSGKTERVLIKISWVIAIAIYLFIAWFLWKLAVIVFTN